MITGSGVPVTSRPNLSRLRDVDVLPPLTPTASRGTAEAEAITLAVAAGAVAVLNKAKEEEEGGSDEDARSCASSSAR